MNLVKYIGSQFSNPRGLGGKVSTFFMNQLNRKQYKAVVNLYHEKRPNYVLDVGFGNGHLLERLSRDGRATYYGIEVSEDMVKQASKKNAKIIKAEKLFLSKGDVVGLDFGNDTFDFVYSVNTVYFWSDFDKGYSEIHRTLKPGGVFANVFYTKEWLDKLKYTKYGFTKYSQTEMVGLVEKMVFAKVELVEIKKDCAYGLLAYK